MKMVNLISDQVTRLREEHGWTQEELSGRLQLGGWDISRSNLSKIENCTLYVPEFRLFYLAHVFNLPDVMPLLPTIDPKKPVHEAILRLIYNEKRGLIPDNFPDPLCLKSKKFL